MNRRDFLRIAARSTAAAAALSVAAPMAFAASPIQGESPINTATFSGGVRVALYRGKNRKHYYAMVEQKGKRTLKTFRVKRGGRVFEEGKNGDKMRMRVGNQTFDITTNNGTINWTGVNGGGSGEAHAMGWGGLVIIVAIGLAALAASAGPPAEEASTAIETVTEALGGGSGEIGEGGDGEEEE